MLGLVETAGGLGDPRTPSSSVSASRCQAAALCPASAIAARQAVACRFPASVASPASSASISVSPGPPVGEPAQDGPAQLRVHGQARYLAAAVEQPGDQVELRRGGGRPAEQLRPRELVITARLGGVQQAGRPPPARPCPSGTHAGSAGQRQQLPGDRVQDLQHRDRGLPAHAPRQHAHERGEWQLGLAQHVDGGAPAHRAGERVGKLADRLGQGRDGPGVEADERIVQVAVVEQDQVGLPEPGQLRHLGARRRRSRPPAGATRVSAPSTRPYRPTAR